MRQIFIAVLIGLLANTALAAERTTYTRNVAVVIYKDAEPLDWTGPYEVWNDAANFGASNGQRAFNVYTVSKTTEPLSSQGMKIVPDYSIANAPKPDIIVIPGGNSANVINDAEFLAWAQEGSDRGGSGGDGVHGSIRARQDRTRQRHCGQQCHLRNHREQCRTVDCHQRYTQRRTAGKHHGCVVAQQRL